MNLTTLLGNDSHIFAVYPNKDTEIDDCFSFLKEGLDNNEFVLILLEEPSIHKLNHKICSEFGKDITKGIDDSNSVVITPLSDWYHYHYSDFNAETFLAEWEKIVSNAKKMKKKGVRVFVEADEYLIERFENALIKFDGILQSYLSFPISTIYAYKRKDIEGMNPQQLALLSLNHGLVRTNGLCSSNYGNDNLFRYPFCNHCICLPNADTVTNKLSTDSMKVDDRELFLNDTMTIALSDFINEGLRQGDRCIYVTARIGNDSLSYQFLSKIIDYEENIKKHNFQLIDFSEHYIDSLSYNIAPLENFIRYLRRESILSVTGKIRFVCDCAGTLFKNKYFEQCIALENWWIRNLPKNVIRLTIYPALLFSQTPYKYNVKPILSNSSTSLIMSDCTIN
ncbi:MAG TPA: MEDS domain-containing protein [Candidatus Nitrosocosmicus sp.]|nr:MEDS domain-containing protein [Candidatus Nitrosocosmicus sp.]